MVKKIIITLGVVLINIVSFSQQITNGDFENWTDTHTAVGWDFLHSEPFDFYTGERTSDSNQDSYALKLESNNLFGFFFPGIATLGEIDPNTQAISGGMPFTDRPTGLSYFFKYFPQSSDTTFMISLLTKWNETTNQTDTIGMTGYFTADTYDAYTELNVPFIYNSTEAPDTLNVTFFSSGFAGTVGSTLYVDDVTLLYGAVISPTLCFPAADTTYNQFTARCMTIPTASSYSLDVSESSDFSSFVSGYEDLDIGADTFKVVSPIASSLYFYRFRVVYGTEISINSNTIAVPMPILNLDVTEVSSNSFTANWQAANSATNYYIDVATDANFTNIVDGYSNLSVGNATGYLIENLNSETEYFYRIRTQYDTYTSNNSNVISINTSVGIEDLISQSLNVYYDKDRIVISCRSEYLPNEIVVYNIQGKQVAKVLNATSYETIKLKKQGVYIVSLKFNDFVTSKKVVLLF